jgi:hypothetical protein
MPIYDMSDVKRMKAGKDVDGLVQALDSFDKQIRMLACLALREVGDSHAVEPLIAVLGDVDHTVRRMAARALVELYGSNVITTEQKTSILSHREEMITGTSRQEHRDTPSKHDDHYADFSKEGTCIGWEPAGTRSGHTDAPGVHEDVPAVEGNGIGIDFPL